jgi:aspartate/glutamate racemase
MAGVLTIGMLGGMSWESSAEYYRLLADVARRVEAAGADLLVLCTNTMHKVADQIAAAVGLFRVNRGARRRGRGGCRTRLHRNRVADRAG